MCRNNLQTLDQVIELYGGSARKRLRPWLRAADVGGPPARLAILAFKQERLLELWAQGRRGWRSVRTYPILAASGGPGPKLREGDRQVPEGTYRVIALNPNSRFHLSMRLDFPNDFDRRHARDEGRYEPGSNIFIHGDTRSSGCLAMGDTAIEELFMASYDVGYANVSVVIAPNDLRVSCAVTDLRRAPPWTSELYALIQRKLAPFSPRSSAVE